MANELVTASDPPNATAYLGGVVRRGGITHPCYVLAGAVCGFNDVVAYRQLADNPQKI